MLSPLISSGIMPAFGAEQRKPSRVYRIMEKMGLAHLAPARFQPYPPDYFEIKRRPCGGSDLYREFSAGMVRNPVAE